MGQSLSIALAQANIELEGFRVSSCVLEKLKTQKATDILADFVLEKSE